MLAFLRSLALLAVVLVGAPIALIAAARSRFDGGAPFHGVPSPTDWEFARIRAALTDRLTDQTIADVVIRLSLTVVWIAVAVMVVTIVAELIHMLRHDGLAMPDIRGLGLPQSAARFIAAGLLVVVPMISGPGRAVARDGAELIPTARAASVVEMTTSATPDNVWLGRADPAGTFSAGSTDTPRPSTVDEPALTAAPTSASVATGQHVVVAGDSIFSIAERHAGPDQQTVAAYADRLLDLNLGQQMPDGQRFTNAAYIEVGWVLQLPASPAAAVSRPVSSVSDGTGRHVVAEGESLWSIADDELGDAERWPEIFAANEGRTFDDGRRLDDADLIQPGWELQVPVDETAAPSVSPDAAPEAGSEAPAVIDQVDLPSSEAPMDVVIEPVIADRGEMPGVPGVPDNVWTSHPVEAAPGAPAVSEEASEAATPLAPATGTSHVAGPRDAAEQDTPQLLTLGRAAMLSGGVLTLLAVRRRKQLRGARPRARLPEPPPEAAATERALRAIDSGERFARVDVAIRATASALIRSDARLLAVLVADDGAIELSASRSVQLDPPWEGDGDRWQLPATTPLELLADAARRVGAPSPTLVQLGRDDSGRDVYVDLEGIEALEIGGPGGQADAIVAALAASLAGSVLAEVTTLIGVGVPDEAFLGHRLHVPVRDSQQAFEAARRAIGSTATQTRTTFELRSRATAGETWEPAVVLVGAAVGNLVPPKDRTGLAVVSASPIHGPSSRLAPAGGSWSLLPADVRLTPVGLSRADLAALSALVEVAEPVDPIEPELVDDDFTLAPPVDRSIWDDAVANRGEDRVPVDQVFDLAPRRDTSELPWRILVRLVGPVEVGDADGTLVGFERSKTRELLAWLATHRTRATRTSARTALWELDVRDSTFANVVSEARRSLARLVPPPGDDEWVGRTMTDALPLHELVRTDADIIEFALDVARLQPPAQAIATLSPAVDLIEGVPFEGTSYLWPDAEGITSNLVLLPTTASTELAAHCLSVGDIEGVFAATGRGLRVLPGHEELIGLRMHAHARAGDHAGVRQEWESYERVINADPWSDGEPSPKLVELRRELLNPSR